MNDSVGYLRMYGILFWEQRHELGGGLRLSHICVLVFSFYLNIIISIFYQFKSMSQFPQLIKYWQLSFLNRAVNLSSTYELGFLSKIEVMDLFIFEKSWKSWCFCAFLGYACLSIVSGVVVLHHVFYACALIARQGLSAVLWAM